MTTFTVLVGGAKKVRRGAWPEGQYIDVTSTGGLLLTEPTRPDTAVYWTPWLDDLLAVDWEVAQ